MSNVSNKADFHQALKFSHDDQITHDALKEILFPSIQNNISIWELDETNQSSDSISIFTLNNPSGRDSSRIFQWSISKSRVLGHSREVISSGPQS